MSIKRFEKEELAFVGRLTSFSYFSAETMNRAMYNIQFPLLALSPFSTRTLSEGIDLPHANQQKDRLFIYCKFSIVFRRALRITTIDMKLLVIKGILSSGNVVRKLNYLQIM